MNPLLHWLNAPEWTQLVAALLHSLWQAALLAILLAVLLRRLTQPRLRYYASLGTLGTLVLASILTWAVLTAPKTNAPVAPAPLATESTVAPIFAPTLSLDSPDIVIAFGTPISPAPPTVPWTAWLALVWMLGALAMLFRAGIKVAGAEKLRRSCQPLTDETMTLLVVEACRAINLARKIRVAVTDQLTSPAVVGILVPTLILPLSLFTTLTPEQIRFILLHELAHIRRGDYLANLFQLLAEALLFFNPAVWWLSHHIRREREACCDALAIELSGAPADYAKTLVHVAENTLAPAPSTALAFGEDGREPSSLADRVQRLLVPGYRPALRLTWRAMLMSLFVGGTLLFLSAVGTRNTVGAILSPEKSSPESQQPSQSKLSTAASTSDGAFPREASNTNLLTGSDFFNQLIESIESRDGMHLTNSAPVNISTGRVAQIGTSMIERNVAAADNLPSRTTNSESTPPQHIEITGSGSMTFDYNSETISVTNGGRIKFLGQELTADQIQIDQATGDVVARGNAQFVTTKGTYSGSELRMNLPKQSTQANRSPVSIEFVGYDLATAATFVPAAITGTGESNSSVLPLPIFRVRPFTTSNNWGDVQTNLLGGIKDKVPFLGDIPLLAEYFSSKSSQLTNGSTPFGMGWAATTNEDSNPPRVWDRSAVTLASPRPAPPLAERTFEVDPVKLYEAVRKAAAEPASVNRTNFASAFRNYFSQAGIDFDPSTGRSFYLNDTRGQMWVRATATELDVIEKLLEPMRGGEPLERRTYHVDSNQLAQVVARLPAGLRQIMATNAAAGFQVLLESFHPNDFRPKQVRAFPARNEFTARATAEDFSLFETRLGISPLPTDQLSTREYKLPVEVVQTRILSNASSLQVNQKDGVLQTLDANRMELAQQTMRDWFANAGVELDPNQGKSIFYNDRAGIVWARATPEELDSLESAIQELMWQPPQVHLKVRWVEMSELPKITSLYTNRPYFISDDIKIMSLSGTLNRTQAYQFFQQLRSDPKFRLVNEGQVTTLTDRQAQIQALDVNTVVTGIRTRAHQPPWSHDDKSTNASYILSQAVPLGPVIDLLPSVEPDGWHIKVRAMATITELAGYTPGPEIQNEANGQKSPTTLPLPKYLIRQLTNDFVLRDSETFFFGNRHTVESVRQPDGTFRTTDITAQQTNYLVVFITAMILDPSGFPTPPQGAAPLKQIPPQPR
jgi:beta-lactamase regulating signal transducer with metallopeptidase domain